MSTHLAAIHDDSTRPDGWRRIARAYRYQEWLERSAMHAAIDAAGDLAGRRILDAGAGTGVLAEALRQRSEQPASVVLLDSSRGMLDQARRRGDPGHALVHADLRSMPLADASIDVAFINYVLHIVEARDVASIVDELHRVLRPGGVLVCVTPMASGRLARTLMHSVSRLASGTPAWRIGGLRPLDPTSMLVQAGFDVAHARHVGRGYPSLVVRACRTIRASTESPERSMGQTVYGT